MAHYAELDENNIVLRVIVIDDKYEENGEAWCASMFGGTWKQTSYNTHNGQHKYGKAPKGKNFAGKGYKYDAQTDAFIPPKNYPSWVLNDSKGIYEAPKPYPDSSKEYDWNESRLDWELRE